MIALAKKNIAFVEAAQLRGHAIKQLVDLFLRKEGEERVGEGHRLFFGEVVRKKRKERGQKLLVG